MFTITSERYVWGLDLSLSCTGITIYDLEESKFIASDYFLTSSIRKPYSDNTDLMSLKLFKITQLIKKYMIEYPPSAVGIERLYVPPKGKGIASAEVNYRVHGIINCLLYKVPQYYYTPSTIKMNVQNGRAPKNVVKACLLLRFPELKDFYKHNNYGTRKQPKWTDEDQADSTGACLSLLLDEKLITYEKPLLSEIKPIIDEEDQLNEFLLKTKPKRGANK